MKTKMSQKEFEQHVAKLHLEPGDSLLVDMRLFSVEDMRFPRDAPTDVRIFPVIPEFGGTLRDAFDIIHQDELTKMTREKLFLAIRMLSTASPRIESIIDGIETDFCQCGMVDLFKSGVDHCAIHERCAVLRSLISAEDKEPINATL